MGVADLRRKPKSCEKIAGVVRLEYSTLGRIGASSAVTVPPGPAWEHSSM
jgi:hypothetical protein